MDKSITPEELTACTGVKCPLRNYCEHFRNHELKNTKSYFSVHCFRSSLIIVFLFRHT